MEELQAELAQIMADFQRQALSEYRIAVQQQGLEFTKELENSFRSTLRIEAQGYVQQCEIQFQHYGRYRDMKVLNTGRRMAPAEALEYWVEKLVQQQSAGAFLKGVWRDRYGSIKSQSKLIRDIAWGVRIARKRQIRYERQGKGWYNVKTGVQFARVGERVRQAAALTALRFIKQALN